MVNPMDLSGKHFIITGASSGIGRASCILASQLGAKISMTARNEERLRETLSLMSGEGHEYYIYDFNDINGIEALIKSIVDKNGTIDGLVHCAGICHNRPIKLDTPESVEKMLRISYFAFVEIIRTALSKKRTNKGASYLGISSVASMGGNKTQGAYASAKGAMNSLVHPYAKELAAKEIRINTIAFGMVDTDMYRRDFLDAGGDNEAFLREQYLGLIPVEYAAKAVCFMLSDASKYMTGGTMIYDAGFLS